MFTYLSIIGPFYLFLTNVKFCLIVTIRNLFIAFRFLCTMIYLGDSCIQICHLGRYIVGYMVGNFVLRRRVSGAVKQT